MPDAPLPPGTILQLLYVRERMRRLPAGRFVEVGTGEGALSQALLGLGWRGRGYDLNGAAVASAAARNAAAVADGRYAVVEGDWFAQQSERADLLVTAMVLEHLDEATVARFLERAAATVAPDGRLVVLVPASPAHWGVEDDVAGHLRRYTPASLRQALEEGGWIVEHVAGLTYPLSNVLLRVSNLLVARHERNQLELDQTTRTVASGRRRVPWKTTFPAAARIVLNPVALYPLHLLQKALRGVDGALVLYAEARPPAGTAATTV